MQSEYGQLTAERRVVRQRRVTADRAETGVRIGEASREADAGPAADARQDAHELFAAMLIGETFPMMPDGVLNL